MKLIYGIDGCQDEAAEMAEPKSGTFGLSDDGTPVAHWELSELRVLVLKLPGGRLLDVYSKHEMSEIENANSLVSSQTRSVTLLPAILFPIIRRPDSRCSPDQTRSLRLRLLW